MTLTISKNRMRDAACGYAKRGWPVVALHGLGDGDCTCGRRDCGSPGKHPRTARGAKDATCDPAVIKGWWERWPDANIGVATGERSGFVVLDIDPRHGGDRSLASLEEQHGKLPSTFLVNTGGGGQHLYFRHPGGVVRCRTGVAAGLDFKADGGYVIAPPSGHHSGRPYQDGATSWKEMAEIPSWLLDLLETHGQSESPQTFDAAGAIPAGERNSVLASLAGVMRQRNMSLVAIEAALLQENATRCKPPLSESEVRGIARSIGRYPSGAKADAWPAKLTEEAYHGLAGEFVRRVEPCTEADPAALLGQFLLGFGNLIGRCAKFNVEADDHYPNLFLVLVGESAKGRKGTAWGHVRSCLGHIDPVWAKERVQSGLSSGEGLIWAVRDPIETSAPIKSKGRTTGYEKVISDPGIGDKRLLVLEPEFASTLRVQNRDGSTLSAQIRQAWDKGTLRVLTKNSPAAATEAHISIVGHITRDELRRYLDRTETGNGFANRFLWVCVKRSRILPEGGRLDEKLLLPFRLGLNGAAGFARGLKGACIAKDREAQELWAKVYPQLSEGKSGLLGAVISRAEAQVMRLALVYALLDRSREIRRVHLVAALALWRYAEDSARYIFGGAHGDPLADAVIALLREAPHGLTRAELSSRLVGHHKTERLESVLSALRHNGFLRSEQEQTGGRSAERWSIAAGEGKGR